MLKAKFAQTKPCERCGGTITRKRGALSDTAWEEKRFCSRPCYYDWQREQGPRGSEGHIEECAAPECSRTFWAYRSQKYCRDPRCIEVRNREMARLHIERNGTPHDLHEFDQAVRDGELRRLIAAQEFDQKHGYRFMADTKNGLAVKRLDEVVFQSFGSASDATDHVEIVEDGSGIPRAVGRRRVHSHVPTRSGYASGDTSAVYRTGREGGSGKRIGP